MRKYRRGIALLLAGVMMLGAAGCNKDSAGTELGTENSGNGSVNAKGRYMESQLATPEGLTAIHNFTRLADGSLAIVDIDNATLNLSTDDGASWSGQELDYLVELIQNENMEINSVAVAPDGGVFVAYCNWAEASEEDSAYPTHYLYCDAQGNRQELNLELEGGGCVEDAVFTEDGRLFAIGNAGGCYEILLTEEKANTMFADSSHGFFGLQACGNYLIAVDESQAYLYNLTTKEEEKDEVLSDEVQKLGYDAFTFVMCAGTEENTIYIANQNGIYSHVIGGNVMEQLTEAGLINLGDPTRTAAGILTAKDGSLIIAYVDGELDSYVYDAEAPAVPDEQLTIYGLNDSETMRLAISKFRKDHPDVYVKFEVGLAGDDGVTASDAIKNLNTELLAGNGPDILLLDGMPMDSYQEKGLLSDLSGLVKEAEEGDSYFTNILEAYQKDEQIYAIPIHYEVPLLAGKQENIDGVDGLTDLADMAEIIADSGNAKETAEGSYTAESLLQKYYPVCGDAWRDSKGDINEESITEYLTQLKRIYDANQKNLDDAESADYDELARRRTELGISVMDQIRDIDNQIYSMLDSSQGIAAGSLKSMEGFKSLYSAGKDYNIAYQSLTGQTVGTFIPDGVVGITSNCKEPELAQEFLQSLLSAQVQSVKGEEGFPVSQTAYDAYTKNDHPDIYEGIAIEDSDGNTIQMGIQWPGDAAVAAMKELIGTLDTPAATDTNVEDMIVELGAKALTGEKNIEDSVNEIMQKMSLYLEE